MSAFDRSDKSVEKFESRLKGLNRKLEVQKQVAQEAKREYQKMVQEFGEGSRQAEKAAREMNNQQGALNNLSRYVERTTSELQDLRREQDFVNSRWGKMSQQMNDFSDRMNSAGKKFGDAGKKLTLGVTVPIVGLGGAALKAGMDFEEAMSEVQAISGATGKDLQALEDMAKKMGKETKFSASESAQAMKYMSLAGWDAQQTIAGLPGVLNLAAAGGMDLAQASDIVTDVMSSFGMKAESAGHASDVFAYAQAHANTNVEQLGEAMKYAAPVANSLGWGIEETASAMMSLADNGIKGSMAGQAFASSLGRLAKPTKAMKKVMKDLNLSFFDAKGNMKPMPELIKNIEKGTSGLNNEQKSAALTTLFGAEAYKHWAILLKDGSDKLDKNTKSLEESNGAADKMAKTMNDNAKGNIKEFMSALENLSIMASEHLIPPLTDIVKKMTDMARKFGELKPETQKAIIGIAGVAAAIGPMSIAFGGAMRIVGTFSGGIGRLIGVMGRASTASSAAGTAVNAMGRTAATTGSNVARSATSMGRAAGTMGRLGKIASVARVGLVALTGPVGLIVGAIAGLTVAGIALYKNWDKIMNMSPALRNAILALGGPVTLVVGAIKGIQKANEEVLPSISNLTEGLSKGTEKAVGSYMKLDEKVSEKLNDLAWSQTTITGKMKDQIVGTFDKMSEMTLSKMKENHAKLNDETQKFFNDTNVLSKAQEQKRMEQLQAKNKAEEDEYKKNKERIKAILDKASKEKRSLTKAEADEIGRIQENMRNKAVEELSSSEKEQMIIAERLKNNKGALEAQEAAETVQRSEKTRKKVVKEANKKYEDTIAEAIRQRDELGTISQSEYEKIVAKAEKTRRETIDEANLRHQKIVKAARDQAGEHVDQVNWETGQVLNGWQSIGNGIIDAINWIRSKVFNMSKLPHIGALKKKRYVYDGGPKATGVQNYATGTKNGNHMGGPAIVGEEGPELAHIPNRGLTIVGQKGPEFISNLPKGSSVLPNKHTENVLKSYGFPGYAGGIGKYFDWIMKGPKALWNKAKNMFGVNDGPAKKSKVNNSFGSISGVMSKGIIKVIKGYIDKFTGGLGNLKGGSFSGGGSTKARNWIMQAMKITGTPMMYLNSLMQIAQKESGFNPNAINKWDSNWKAGHPSKGLFQTIDGTFNAYKMPGMNDIYNPIHNAVAAIRYMNSRYGGIQNVPGIRAMISGRGYVGYDTGGLVKNSGLYQLAEGGYPEWVIPTDPSKRTDAMKLLALAGKDIGNKRPNQMSAPYNPDNRILEKLEQQVAETKQAVALLAQILAKDTNVYLDPRQIGKQVERYVTKQQNSKQRVGDLFA